MASQATLDAPGDLMGSDISDLVLNDNSPNLTLEKTAPLWGAALQGATRTILGAAFGVVIVIAIKADVVLAFFKDSFFGIIASGDMAGFSERAVPEVLEGLAEKARSEVQYKGQSRNTRASNKSDAGDGK